MQLLDKSGIICDHCGLQFKHDFTYYSMDYRQVLVTNNRVPSLDMMLNMRVSLSSDMCTMCYDLLKEVIVRNYTSRMDKKKEGYCECCNVAMTHTYTFYYVVAAEVAVRMTNQPNICIKCRAKTFESGKTCVTCGGGDFIKPARVVPIHRSLEFHMCDKDMLAIKEKMSKVKDLISNGWTTRA